MHLVTRMWTDFSRSCETLKTGLEDKRLCVIEDGCPTMATTSQFFIETD